MTFEGNDNVQNVRERVNIVDIISRYVTLEKSGKKYKALCPFHGEKTPSFYVDPSTGLYYCFGCQQGGDVFTFLMNIEGWNFVETLRFLADEYNVELVQSNVKYSRTDKLFKVNNMVLDFYIGQLQESNGKVALQYLQRRGFTLDTINEAQLGYACNGWANLVNYFRQQKIPLKIAYEIGLLSVSNNTANSEVRYYDKFRNRIIFPIRDILGRIVGFGGRTIGDGQPKYLNSPETTLYHKSKSLYGIYKAKSSIKDSKVAIIMEGYIDVLAAWQAGVTNAIATLGTSFTIEQAKLLKRYAETCVLCYDGDKAGLKATQKAVSMLRQVNMDVKVISLPDSLDPDDYIKKFGALEFKKQIMNNSGNAFDFLVITAEKKYNLNNNDSKLQFAAELVSLISKVENHIEQAGYIARYAEKYNLDKKALELEVQRYKKNVATAYKRDTVNTNRNINNNSHKADKVRNAVNKKERKLLRLLINSRNEVAENIFSNSTHVTIYGLIQNTKWDTPKDLVAVCQSEKEKQILASILMIDEDYETEQELIQQLSNFKIERKITALRKKIKEVVSIGEDPSDLLKDFSKLERARAQLFKEDDLV